MDRVPLPAKPVLLIWAHAVGLDRREMSLPSPTCRYITHAGEDEDGVKSA